MTGATRPVEVESPRLGDLADRLRATRTAGMVISGGRLEGSRWLLDGVVQVLVRPGQGRHARSVLAAADWRYELGGRGWWRLSPRREYVWDDLVVRLHPRPYLAPLPGVAGRGLARRVWAEVSRDVFGLVEPGPRARELLERTDARRSRGTAPVSGVWRLAWLPVRVMAKYARPQGLRRLMRTRPWLGRAPARTRFAGLVLGVDQGVFVPRAASEPLVRLAVEALEAHATPVVVEIGTGCGAVGLAVAQAVPVAQVHLSELDARAVSCARRNARALGGHGHVRVYRGSLADALPASLGGTVVVVVGNIPYLPAERFDADATGLAPSTSVGADEDALGLQRRLMDQAHRLLVPDGYLVLQVATFQVEQVERDLSLRGYRLVRTVEAVAGTTALLAQRVPAS